jgi:hypothetical protein
MSLRSVAILVAILPVGWSCTGGSSSHDVIRNDAAVPVGSEDAAVADNDAAPADRPPTSDGASHDSSARDAEAEHVGVDVRVADAGSSDLGVDLAGAHDAGDAAAADAASTADTAPDSLPDAPGDSSTPEADPPASCTPSANDPSRAAVAILGTPLPCSGAATYQYVQFTTPASPGGGGYVVVKFTDGISKLDTFLYMGDDTGFAHSLFELHAGNGGELTYWFAAYPATSYVIRVNDLYGGGLGPFTFTATYTPVYSALRANLSGPDARPQLTVGTPVEDYVFRGYRTRLSDTWSWSYKVTLAAGPATVTLSNLSPDFYTEARMNDAFGSDWYSPFTPMGQDFTLTTGGPVAAGEYVIWVEAYMNPKAYGVGDTPNSFVTKPFTMVVKQ